MADEFAFDDVVDRFGTWSANWDVHGSDFDPPLISMAVAEMEFPTAPPVRRAVEQSASRGVYSYTEVFPDFGRACSGWFARHHSFEFSPESVVFAPRIVEVVSAILNHVLADHPKVVTLSPAYGPILEVVRESGCAVVEVPLLGSPRDGWSIDFDLLAQSLASAEVFILTNPHNPTGRVWSESELEAVADAVRASGVLVISDDIHGDVTRPDHSWLPLARVAPDLSESGRIITCLSPGKTFNMAGLEASAIVVENETLRNQLKRAIRAAGLHNPNYFAIPAAIAAWTDGDSWLAAVNSYIDANLRYVHERFSRELAGVVSAIPEATFLMWVDGRELGLDKKKIDHITRDSNVLVTPGEDYGAHWAGYFRMSVAMPASMLSEAMDRLISALRIP